MTLEFDPQCGTAQPEDSLQVIRTITWCFILLNCLFFSSYYYYYYLILAQGSYWLPCISKYLELYVQNEEFFMTD